MNASRELVFISRDTLLNDARTPPRRRHSGTRSPPPATSYESVVPVFDDDDVFRKVVGTRDGGNRPQTWEDADASRIDTVKQYQLDVATNGDLSQAVYWKLQQFKDPLDRVDSMTVVPFYDPQDATQIEAALGREIGHRVTLLETPPGFAAEKTGDYRIQSIAG